MSHTLPKYRENLSSILQNHRFITCTGEETTLVYHHYMHLPHFAAIMALRTEEGAAIVAEILRQHAKLAVKYHVGIILESSGWRGNSDWLTSLNLTQTEMDDLNRKSVEIMQKIREEMETPQSPMIIAGVIGPRADGYTVDRKMDIWQAESYHRHQIELYRDAGVDIITAMTMNYVEEAIGIAKAAYHCNMPVAISFTVETNGHLPSGQMLKAAITEVDLVSNEYPVYYMINCAHPNHFVDALLEEDTPWLHRLRAVKVNSSKKSHAELDTMTTLDEGDMQELGEDMKKLSSRFPWITILGGCCGTDVRHMASICESCYKDK